MNAIILCGGLSTRLGDIAKSIPKILLKVGDKSVLDWQLEKLKRIGIQEVVFAAGHLIDVLRDRIGNEYLGMRIIYAIEDEPLGTGGAIKHGLKYISKKEDPTWVLNGDIMYSIDFKDMLENFKNESDGIILGVKVEDASTYGTIYFDENSLITAFKEKEGLVQQGYINGGLYLFNPGIEKYFPESDVFSVEYYMFPNMKKLYIYPSDNAWIDIGIPDRLEWARENWKEFI